MEQEDYNEWVEDSHSRPAPSLGGDSGGWREERPERRGGGGRGGRGRGRGRQTFGAGNNDSWESNRPDNSGWESNRPDNSGWESNKPDDSGWETSQSNNSGWENNRSESSGWDNSRSENGWEDKKSDNFGERRGRGARGGGRGRGQGRRYDNNDDFGGGTWGNKSDGDNGFSVRERDNEGWEGNGGDSFGSEGFGGRGRGRGRGGGRGGRRDNDGFGGSGFENNDGDKKGEGPEKPKERYIPPDPTDDENVMFGNNISSGINFDKYDDIQIKVTGENVPQPINAFEDCQLRNLLINNIKKSGYNRPTPVQKYALPIICDGRDLMACAQTGSGKTAAFLLPILHNLLESAPDAQPGRPAEPQVVICSPTRELTIQIFNEARKFAHGSTLKICIAYGGTVVYHQAQAIARGCNVLVATPGRLNDFLNRNNVRFSQVSCFVLDEADRMLDMGFQPEIEKMLEHESMPPSGQRQTLMFSATFPEEIQRLAGNYLKDYLFLAVGIVGGACADVTQTFYEVSKFDKRTKLVEILRENSASAQELTLVFVEEKRTADFIAAFLCENNFPTTSIHGDRLQSQREEALRDFKAGRRPILVATAVAARGLDIKNVAHVVNYDMPKGTDEYVHRIGRTGRVGNRGRATSFFEPSTDGRLAAGLVKILEQTKQEVPAFLSSACNGDLGGGQFEFGDAGFGGEDVRGESSFMNYSSNTGARAIEQEEEWN